MMGWEVQVYSEHLGKWLETGFYRTRAEAEAVAGQLQQYRKRRVVSVRISQERNEENARLGRLFRDDESH